MPVELCAHTLYTQLADFKLNNELNTSLKTICITSLEMTTVKALCDIFSNYNENYSSTSWAIPLSPMDKLLQQHREDIQHLPKPKPQPQPSQSQTKPIPFTNNTNNEINVRSVETNSKSDKRDRDAHFQAKSTSEPNENINTNSKQSSHSNANTTNLEKSAAKKQPERIVENDRITIFNNNTHKNMNNNSAACSVTVEDLPDNSKFPTKERTFSEHSNTSRSGSSTWDTNSGASNAFLSARHDKYCLICQQEDDIPSLISCGSLSCTKAFCSTCILNYVANAKSQKCPGCKAEIDKNILANLNDSRSKCSGGSFSSSPRTNLMQIQFTNNPGNANSTRRIVVPNSGHQAVRTNVTTNNASNYNNKPHSNKNTSFNNNSSSNNNAANMYTYKTNDAGSSSGVSSHSSSSSGSSNNNNHTSNRSVHKYPITDATIKVRTLDSPCVGYENFSTLVISFEVPDGIQNVRKTNLNHPQIT